LELLVSAEPNPIRHRPTYESVAFAVALPIVMIAACALARLMWPQGLGSRVRFETMAIVGLLGYLLGTFTLGRALRLAKARWVVALVVYDLAMPFALFGFLILIEAGHRGFQ
jgi:hypothetical protein